ncbi:MAG: PLP-dependent lyase/thiolase [Acidimicrobiia bacterium]|nr:PLP-dependent lyase/thiolase [Acidimicrobiia bacterium]MYB74724.1 PLP-dependent lyase/thiolase [Acidimicrobiia bacterium]MYH99331.1 PLP-dependent lyase/thiolase [Acidimicrobiia bacterium]
MTPPPLVCSCGAPATGGSWACKWRGEDDQDHVLALPRPEWSVDPSSQQPFVRYRRMLRSWAESEDDEWFVDRVGQLDAAVARVDGHGFEVTPCSSALVSGRSVIIKDETDNVSGSHKARHTFGLMLHLLVRERRAGAPADRPQLAIASCGNAALAAAVVAAAERWPLTVYVPTFAEEAVVDRLRELGATVEVCPRVDGEDGDPSYHRFREAVSAGAVPFGCQGPDNGYTIDGGRTLGYELAEQAPGIDRVYVQVGGGALTASVAQGLAIGGSSASLIAVQTEGCAPLARAWHRTSDLGGLDEARRQRASVMWPWTPTPSSAATGILDDETYDWAAVTEAMASTGGHPVVVPEPVVIEACEVGRSATGINVSPTGSAGLAGLLCDDPPAHASPAVLFTGAQR